MKIKKKKLALFGLFFSTCSFAFLGANTLMVSADNFNIAYDLFDTKNMTMSLDSTVEGINGSGIKLSGERSGCYAVLTNALSGDCSVELLPIDDDKISLTEVSVVITDVKSKKNFKITAERSSMGSQAYVEANGEKVGLYYYDYYGNIGFGNVTTGNNLADTYTTLTGDGAYLFDYSPTTGSVKVGRKNGPKWEVWNMSQIEMDGRTVGFSYEPFEEYTVAIEFGKIANNTTANALLYSINGQPMDGVLLEDITGPGVYSDVSYNAVLGVAYKIPMPTISDMFEGGINSRTAKIEIIDEKGNIVFNSFYNKNVTYTFNKIGRYQLSYICTDSNGNLSKFSSSLDVVEQSVAELNVVYSNTLDETTIIDGGVVLPSAKVESVLIKKEVEPLFLSVMRNGNVVEGYENISAEKEVLFISTESGEYTVVYSDLQGYLDYENSITFHYKSSLRLERSSYEKTQRLNSIFTMPTASIVDRSGQEIKTEVSLTYPSGLTVKKLETKLNECGTYELSYTANVNGMMQTYRENFLVELYSEDVFTAKNATITYSPNNVNSNINGVYVQSDSSGEVVYNKTIDLSKLSKDDILLEIMATPKKYNSLEFNEFIITLTDVHDEQNYITISCLDGGLQNGGGVITYIKAAANNGSVLGGLESISGPNTNRYGGFLSRHSFSGILYGDMGVTNLLTPFRKTIKLYFDYEERALYAFGYKADDRDLVLDFDEASYMRYLWDGFTTGECTMKISVSGVGSQANYTILGVNGYSLENREIKDNKGPEITVDMLGLATAPKGEAGKSYKIFNATAIDDIDASIPSVKVEVGKLEGTSIKNKEVVTGDSFIPDEEGTYAIIYTAQDLTGNISQHVVYVEVLQDLPNVQIEAYGDYVQSGKIGMDVTLAKFATKGGSGYIVSKVLVIDPFGESVEFSDNHFRLTKAGTYLVKCVARDYIGIEDEYSYSIECELSENPIINELPYLPNSFIEGYTVELPKSIGTDWFTGTPKDIEAKIVVTDANGERVLLDNVYVPQVVQDGDIAEIKYIYASSSGETVLTYQIPVRKAIKNGMIDYSKLFTTVNVDSFTIESSGLKITATQSDASIEYIRALADGNFEISFKAAEGEFNADGIIVRLVDADDRNCALRLAIKNVDGVPYLSINDGKFIELYGSFYGNSNSNIKLYYSAANFEIGDARGYTFAKVDKFENGETFQGFPSKKIYISALIEGVKSKSSITLVSLNNQPFSNYLYDTIKPYIQVNGNYGGIYSFNDEVVLPSMTAVDVLSEISTTTISVRVGNKYVTAVDGTLLRNAPANVEYKVKLNELGLYTVTYSARDTVGWANTVSKVISVSDRIKPVINVESFVSTEGKLNEAISMPQINVMDDISEPNKLIGYWFVLRPDGMLCEFDSTSYTPTMTGRYTFTYFVYDEAYNYITYSFTVTIK